MSGTSLLILGYLAVIGALLLIVEFLPLTKRLSRSRKNMIAAPVSVFFLIAEMFAYSPIYDSIHKYHDMEFPGYLMFTALVTAGITIATVVFWSKVSFDGMLERRRLEK